MNGASDFAAAAARLAGQAGAMLGWRPHEFWAATPAELGAIARAAVGEGDGLTDEDVAGLRLLLGRGVDHG